MTRQAQTLAGALDNLQLVAARDPGLPETEFSFWTRPGSSDEPVIIEVVKKHTYRKGWSGEEYQFGVLPGERWLDLGANIGTFSVWAAKQGCRVVAFEPERITHRLLQKNVEENGVGPQVSTLRYAVVSADFHAEHGGQAVLSLGNTGSEWRNTLMKQKSELAQSVQTVPIGMVLQTYGPFDGIKADIEGAELAMFDDDAFLRALAEKPATDKMVFEYHFDIDRDVARFRERMARLGKHFQHVRYGAIPEDAVTYDWFPPSRIVYCYGGRK